MIVDYDTTGLNVVPTSNWTLKEQSAKQVIVTGINDPQMLLSRTSSH